MGLGIGHPHMGVQHVGSMGFGGRLHQLQWCICTYIYIYIMYIHIYVVIGVHICLVHAAWNWPYPYIIYSNRDIHIRQGGIHTMQDLP